MASSSSPQRPLALGLNLDRRDSADRLGQTYNDCPTSTSASGTPEQTSMPGYNLSPMTHLDLDAPSPPYRSREGSGNASHSHSAAAVAGPSNSTGSPTQNHNVPIPPPPNPRRHRSGVLMSRVRAHSSGTNFRSGPMSKSFGDLNLGMTAPDTDYSSKERSRTRADTSGEEYILDLDAQPQSWDRREAGKRIVSEGYRKDSGDEENMWDNSARFYHHLHSRPASRAGSRSTSPVQSPKAISRATTPSTSTSTSPIYVRRALAIPQNANSAGPPSLGGMPTTVSPNHQFLQQHLPPTFPASYDGSSLDHSHPHAHPHSSMVILTPTTQEWRELKEIRRLEGEDIGSSASTTSGSASQSDESRRSSVQEDGSIQSSLLFSRDGKDLTMTTQKPPLRTSMSADFLPLEATHTPDPGASAVPAGGQPTPERPVFSSVIIAPSPITPESNTVPNGIHVTSTEKLSRRRGSLRDLQQDEPESESSPEIDQNQPLGGLGTGNRPARFNSIGRRESLRAIKPPADRPALPREKTKRELERERLFRELDEEIETDAQNGKDRPRSGSSVREIGLGGGLGSRPTSAHRPSFEISDRESMEGQPAEASLLEPQTDLFARTFEKKIVEDRIKAPLGPVSAIRPNPSLSPTQPIKPSPLHASPLNAGSGLPTPDTPQDEDPLIDVSPKTTSEPTFDAGHSANLDTIRDYARALATPYASAEHLREKSGTSASSAGTSSRQRTKTRGRRRDTNRVSLVAGRVVQPFSIPASTALPPPERPGLKSNVSSPSLQSFSPFRSPVSTKSSSAVLPSISRFDSTVSIAPSTGAPSECGTPTSETAGGIGGRGIDDYVILKEAGKGAYGLVMRAKVKGPKGEPVGDEVIIKYIIKARILADCWKKHKQLGPIPVEIHVMDQLRHLLYNPPPKPHPWDPSRPRPDGTRVTSKESLPELPNTPDSPRSDSSAGGSSSFSPTQKYIASEIRHSPERGHPNICKLLDFFEDREFYYLVMPRFGTGVDLFDRVESEPDGLDPFEIRSLLGQLSDAVRFLHANGIVHRDIKDENVVLDGTGRCQLIDFGSAAHWRPGKRWDTFSGTLHYASPEILRGVAYGGKEQDIWALGVVGYVLLVGETPFSDLPDEVLEGLTPDSQAEQALEDRCGYGHEDEGREADGGGSLEEAADFVRRCLENEPADRPSAEALCQHRYLRGDGGWTGKKGWVAHGWR